MDPQPLPPGGAATAAPSRPLRDVRGRPYEPAVGPRLRVLLAFIFAAVAMLGATGIYLASVTLMEYLRNELYQTPFTQWMLLAHVAVGVLLVVPFLVFGLAHLATARHRKNRVAVRLGLLLFLTSILVGLSGVALIQLDGLPQLPTHTLARAVTYFLHVLAPLAALVLYVLHRRAGPEIRWRWGLAWGGAVAAFVLVMVRMHAH